MSKGNEIRKKIHAAIVILGASGDLAKRKLIPALSKLHEQNEIDPSWLEGVQVVGLTAGASTPEELVQKCISKLQELGVDLVEDVEYTQEDVFFQLPKQVLV